AGGQILIDDVNLAVAVAARWAGNIRLVGGEILALAEARERRHPAVDLAIDLDVELVAVILDTQQRLEVVGAAGAVGVRQIIKNLSRERIERGDGYRRARGIHDTGERIDDRGSKYPRAVGQIRDGVEVVVFLYLAKSLVVGEEKKFVLDERA